MTDSYGVHRAHLPLSLAVLILALVLTGCRSTPDATTGPATPQGPTDQPQHPPRAEIAFVSEGGIWAVDPTNAQARQLGKRSGEIDYIACSPDGLQVAFTASELVDRQPDGTYQDSKAGIYLLSAADGATTPLNAEPLPEFGNYNSIAWAPDGQALLLERGYDVESEITSVATDGATIWDGVYGYSPRWSPDGRSIAYYVVDVDDDGEEVCEVWGINSDGSGARRIGLGSNPQWSPDGSSIVFIGFEGPMTMAADGTDVVALADQATGDDVAGTFGNAEYCEWSPAGERIAFVTRDDMTNSVYTCALDGTDLQCVVSGQDLGSVQTFAWMPDGKAIAYIAHDEGRDGYVLSVIDITGGEPRELARAKQLRGPLCHLLSAEGR